MAYAVEMRRRVKEQMNKRKTDDEFGRINLSFIDSAGEEVVVYCPESRAATATQEPSRRNIHAAGGAVQDTAAMPTIATISPPSSMASIAPLEPTPAVAAPQPELAEQRFTIHYGDTGYSYESIVLPYLKSAKAIEIEDPYIRANHQIQNFVRFCEAAIKSPTVRTITLTTSYDADTDVKNVSDRLAELQQSLLELDVALEVKINENLHDREIRIDNGWVIKIGRGLDFFQRPDSWYGIGSNDLSLRRCLETKVDIFRSA